MNKQRLQHSQVLCQQRSTLAPPDAHLGRTCPLADGRGPPARHRDFSFFSFTRAFLNYFVTASKARASSGKRSAARHDDGHGDAEGDDGQQPIRPAFLGRSQRPRQHRDGDSSSEEEEEEYVTPPGKGKGNAAKARARTAAMRSVALSASEEDSYDSSGPGDASQKGEHPSSSSSDTDDGMPIPQPNSDDDDDSNNEAGAPARAAGSGAGRGAGGGGAAAPAAQPQSASKKKPRAPKRTTSVIDRDDIDKLIHCDIDVETGGAIPGMVQLTCVFSIDGEVRLRQHHIRFAKKNIRVSISFSFFWV